MSLNFDNFNSIISLFHHQAKSLKDNAYLWKKIDGLVIDRFGPDGLSKLFKYFSIKAVKFQGGFIYQYAFMLLIGFSLLLTIIIIN